ncbi:hypothetical protein RYX36_000249, partial [Vicia faba]
MAPKKDVASKKYKISRACSSGAQETFDQTKFFEAEQQDRYEELIGRNIVYERIFETNPQGKYKDLSELWTNHKWVTLLNHHHNINTDVLEEFVLEARLLLLFILYNLRPRSHASTFTLDMTQLLYLIMSGERINVAQIIANEMRNVAESGKDFWGGIKSTCPLVYPSLIVGLIIASRVRIPNIVHVKIKTK